MAYGTVIMDTSGSRSALSINGGAVNGQEDEDKTAAAVPIIEMATYAETDVFECYIRGFESRIVMRRKHDDWVNITQVFKLAKFSKTQRTKVLEKESGDMENEKVQGGYGRFQGTWIPLDKAKYMVSKYNIKDPVVSRILEFELDPNNPPVKRSKNSVLKRSSPNGRISSPSSYNKTPKKKSQMGATTLSKKNKKNSIHLQPNPSPLQNIVFQTPQQLHAMSTNNATTISAISNNNESSNEKVLNMSHLNANETPLTMNYSATQKPLQFYPVPTNLTHPQKLSRDKHHLVSFISDGTGQVTYSSQMQSKPNLVNGVLAKSVGKKRKKDKAPIEFLSTGTQGNRVGSFVDDDSHSGKNIKVKHSVMGKGRSIDKSQHNYKMRKQQQMIWQNTRGNELSQNSFNQGYIHHTNLSNASSLEMFSAQEDPTPLSSRSVSPTEYNGIPTAPATAVDNGSNQDHEVENEDNIDLAILSLEEYKDLILQVLSSEDGSDRDYSLPPQLYHPPANLDINFEIDDQGHTPLHWATAMANIPLIKLLIALNANALQCNSRGFNCITKSTFYNNCFKAGTFTEIASILRICLITPDANGRLPLHYLVELSVNKSKDPVVINSYMDAIIHNLGQEDYTVLRMCLNFQDNSGNTALHLAALNLNLELCNKLCYLGSSMDVTNYDNETPASILAKFNLVPPTTASTFLGPQPARGQISTSSTVLEAPVDTTPGMSIPHAQTSRDNLGYHSDRKHNKPEDADSLIDSADVGNQKEAKDEKVVANVSETRPSNPIDSGQENDINVVERDQGNFKLTPYVSPKKMPSRNFLSGADSTFTSLMEDLSNIDSFVTSSVLKDVKGTPSKLLESSPILYRKKVNSTDKHAEANASSGGNEISATHGLKKPIDLPPSLDSPLAAIVASPVAAVQNSRATAGVVALANRLREISNSLVISINAELSTVKSETETAEIGLQGLKKNIKLIGETEQQLLSESDNGLGVTTVGELQDKTHELHESVNDGKQRFISCIEKSQALNLATLVEEEESKVNAELSDQPSPKSLTKDDTMNALKLATELALLQFKRRAELNQISDAKCKINLSSKITKYRRLIGMTVENIDSKLDDIEMDLRANV